MVLIYDAVTASNVAGYYNAKLENVESVGQKAFPVRKQLGIKLSMVKGSKGLPVVLKPAAFDTKVVLRDRMNVTITDEEMPFFKEAMLIKEVDRQQLNLLEATGNQAMIDVMMKTIFDDETTLIKAAEARLEAMRMQVLATGKISVNANGVMKDFDYGVRDENKGTVTTAWTDAAKATPLADLEKASDALMALGSKADVVYMNSKTYSLLKNADSTLKLIKPLAPKGAAVTRAELNAFLEDEYDLKVIVVNQTYIDDDGKVKKYFPDGTVTLAPNAVLGNTVFGTTPEESDLMVGNISGVSVELTHTGIAITTKKLDDPVNVQTKVSMIALPSFEQIDSVYLLDIEP
ncbi:MULTISPECIES: major capsid protein [unclassified Facklamia]|uniref:major capsid protein n=1 Tax=Aerococcaceae TaxID=186827 RepID=UPI0013B970DE|nr:MULTISPECIES: major capsid protein [unclassified Facklamia]MBS4462823.1 major capsid protein [Aerococcaceae bacterium zg-B36]NEW65272.1 major capsid protein E [Facklamia sp. 252]NEW68748.1 major capsid protein E [Facklamia sp. 253]QQD66136.1 major capsid protein [Aerococcaceae bacterium zg-252]